MKRVDRFLHDWRVDVEVKKLQPHVCFDSRIEYRIMATWEGSQEVTELAKMAIAESYEYVNIEVSSKSIYPDAGRIDFNVSEVVLKSLGLEVKK